MSYAKYTTDCFVLSCGPRGEADMMLSLYTEKFGRIEALAKSVRLSKSKLKASLQNGNFLFITLIKGKEIWRLTDAEIKEERVLFPSEGFVMFLKVLKLLKSLVQGQEENKLLFDYLKQTYVFLSERAHFDRLNELECFTVLRILDALGYGLEESFPHLSGTDEIKEEFLLEVEKNKEKIISLINTSLKESHL